MCLDIECTYIYRHSVVVLTNGLRPYDFRAFGMWPIVDDVTNNVREVTKPLIP